MSKKDHNTRKFLEMQIFFQSHSKNEIDENIENIINDEEVTDIGYMMLIEDMLSGEDFESQSMFFGKYKN